MRPARSAKVSVADQVMAELSNRILSGQWPAGVALPPEKVLAEELGVSRSALREALSRLSQARLIVPRQGGATLVTQWTQSAGLDLLGQIMTVGGGEEPEVTDSIFSLREFIYSDSARLCAVRRSEAGAQAIRAIADDLLADPAPTLSHHVPVSPFWTAVCQESRSVPYLLTLNSLNATAAVATDGSPLRGAAYDPGIFGSLADAIVEQDASAAQELGRRVAAEARARWLGPTHDD